MGILDCPSSYPLILMNSQIKKIMRNNGYYSHFVLGFFGDILH